MIVNVAGNLYRAQNNNHFTVFLATPAGIILADPINTAFATWLKAELAQRFGVPVRYVLYSHHHWDHVGGNDELVQEFGNLRVYGHKRDKSRTPRAHPGRKGG